jgi:hypothetical protein
MIWIVGTPGLHPDLMGIALGIVLAVAAILISTLWAEWRR